MKRITCITDTSSIINLDSFVCYKGTLLDMLSREAVIKFSSEVNYEITKDAHYTNTMPGKSILKNKVHFPLMLPNEGCHITLIGGIREREDGSKGEIDNFVVMMDHFLSKRNPPRNPLVYLTDDTKAIDGLLKDSIRAFPYCSFWNSYDVVLFIYLLDRGFSYDMALNAIKQMYRQSLPNNERTDPAKMAEKSKKRDCYLQLLDKVHKMKVLFNN